MRRVFRFRRVLLEDVKVFTEAEIVAPTGALPVLPAIAGTWRKATTSQRWAHAGGLVVEFKRRQTGERDED